MAIAFRLVDWANASGVRIAFYGFAAAASLWAWWRERGDHRCPEWWPAFWLITGGMLTAMALGRLLDVDSLLTQLGRDEALARGLYEDRRRAQAFVVGGIGIVWGLSVVIALWRVPERRRRYLPSAIVVFSLLGFAALRLVSLHQVDSLLYRRDVGDVRVGTIVEVAGLLTVIALSALVAVTAGRSARVGHPATVR